MKRVMTAIVLCGAMTTTLAADTDAGNVTTAKDDCITAWAVLAPGDAFGQEMVKNVVRWHPHWTAGPYEPGVSQRFELHRFDKLQGSIGATVAHCGHGATCNELARAVVKAYPNVGNPMVVCMREPPLILSNPQTL